MTHIDTSKEAVERLASRLAGTPLYEGSGEDSELGEYGAETITALAAERDAQTTRANAAEAEVARLTAELEVRAGHDALVAAAYEAAADTFARHRSIRMSDWADHMSWRHDVYNSIRALTPSDATAALDAKLLAERNKALRDAFAVAHRKRGDGDTPEAILAMIETEANNDR